MVTLLRNGLATDSDAPTPTAPLSMDEEICRVLRCARLESAPIDPSSLSLLHKLVRERAPLKLRHSGETAPTKMPWTTSSSPSSTPVVASGLIGYRKNKARALSPPPPPLRIFEPRLQCLTREPSDLTMQADLASAALFSAVSTGEVSTTASIAGSSIASTGAPTQDDGCSTRLDQRVMRQLEFQAGLLLEIQRRLDDISSKVDRIELCQMSGGKEASTISLNGIPLPSTSILTSTSRATPRKRDVSSRTLQRPRVMFTNPTDIGKYRSNDVPAVVPHESPQKFEQRVFESRVVAYARKSQVLNLLFLQPWSLMIRSRFVRIFRAYWCMRHEHVQPIDGALSLRIMFMAFIVLVRLTRSHQRRSRNDVPMDISEADSKIPLSPLDFLREHRFLLAVSFMAIAVLFQTGYIHYTYNFLFKDQVPRRIWSEESLDDEEFDLVGKKITDLRHTEQMVEPQQLRMPTSDGPPPGHAAQDSEETDDPDVPLAGEHQGSFLRGAIARPIGGRQDDHDDDDYVNIRTVIHAFVQDILYLVGSFVFSIFPMWQPEEDLGNRQRENDEHGNGVHAGVF